MSKKAVPWCGRERSPRPMKKSTFSPSQAHQASFLCIPCAYWVMLSSSRVFPIYFITLFYQPNLEETDIGPNTTDFLVLPPPFMGLLIWSWQCNDFKPVITTVIINEEGQSDTIDNRGQLPKGFEVELKVVATLWRKMRAIDWEVSVLLMEASKCPKL